MEKMLFSPIHVLVRKDKVQNSDKYREEVPVLPLYKGEI